MQWLTLSQIKSSDVERRIQAIETLSREPNLKALLAIIGALSDQSPRVRVAAASALGRTSDERCVEPLHGVLRDSHPQVREAVVRALKAINHTSSLSYLVPLLRDSSPAVRVTVAGALQQLKWAPSSPTEEANYYIALGQLARAAAVGVEAVDPLLNALADESSSGRRAATEALAQIDDPRALAGVARMTSDPDPGVRVVALGALGRARAEGHVHHVLRQLEHPDKNVRACALETLARIGHPDLFTILARAINDSHWTVRAAAASALGRSSEPQAVDALLVALTEADADVRQIVAEALGRLRNPRAIEPLIRAHLDSDSRVRTSTLTALHYIDPYWPETDEAKRALVPLKQALKHRDYDIRHTAADLLNRIFSIRQCEPSLEADVTAESARRQRALDVLTGVLWDEDPLVRFVGVWTLQQIGDPRASQPLQTKLKDADDCVRAAAQQALAVLGAKADPVTGGQELRLVTERSEDNGTGPIV